MTCSQFSTTPTPDDAPRGGLQSGDFIGSTSIISELIRGFDGYPPTYERVKIAIYSGRIPAVKVGGRWMMDRARMGEVAAAFGLIPKASAPARAPAAAVEHAA
jgi:hypothetical protein